MKRLLRRVNLVGSSGMYPAACRYRKNPRRLERRVFIDVAFFAPVSRRVRACGDERNSAMSSCPMAPTVPPGPTSRHHAPNSRTCRRYWPVVWGERPSASSWTRNRASASSMVTAEASLEIGAWSSEAGMGQVHSAARWPGDQGKFPSCRFRSTRQLLSDMQAAKGVKMTDPGTPSVVRAHSVHQPLP